MNKLLKTQREYDAALRRLHSLLDQHPQPNTEVGDEVELLGLLLSTFERTHFEKIEPPTPIEAIRFRMEQLDLAQKDLVKFIGPASRVSEVLSGKRPLTLPMIRALSEGLGIPAKVLIAEPIQQRSGADFIDWSAFPVREISKRGWLGGLGAPVSLQSFVEPVMSFAGAFRRSVHFRGARNVDPNATLAWLARVWWSASSQRNLPTYEQLTDDVVREVVRLSWSSRGPLLAAELLEHYGVPVVLEFGLPKMFLDGATIFTSERPIVGLTLRYDRLDSFWYTLVHELVHVIRHQNCAHRLFLDDTDADATDDLEREADAVTSEFLIPEEAWLKSPASRLRSRQAVEHLARQLHISPAIVAGRVRRQFDDYTVLSDMVGSGTVRALFVADASEESK